MNDNAPVFLVNPYSDPVVIRVNGRASYLNCAPLRDFFSVILTQGRRSIVIDFANCISMDSTFLGIVAGAAMDLADMEPPGRMAMEGLGPRNMDLIRNLGLHKIADVSGLPAVAGAAAGERPLASDSMGKEERTRMIIDAHTRLASVDESNAERFQDVLAFLKKRGSGSGRDE
jgi:anti-anti-sigma regulatory factor